MTTLQNMPIGRWSDRYAAALHLCAEYRADWLREPQNYPPPRWATRPEIEAHHSRWLASPVKAHCDGILREAAPAGAQTTPFEGKDSGCATSLP
jgi:hypothetical protein